MMSDSDNTNVPRRADQVRRQGSSCTKPVEEGTPKVDPFGEELPTRKAVLLAQASHEIKTPLASIMGFTESLLSHGNLTSDDRQDVIAIQRQSQYMSNLVKDLLDIARLEGHRFPFNIMPVNPVQMIDEVVEGVRIRYKEKSLKLLVKYPSKMPEKIKVDPLRFKQVLNQVLSNAYSFTFNGQIEVLVDLVLESDADLILKIYVQDSGIGMTKETQKRIFHAFMRGDFPEVQKTQGTGLGLTLAKSLMRGMRGHLNLVDSQIGVGSLFEMELNVGKTEFPFGSIEKLREERILPEQVGLDSELEGREILVVDDSDDLRVLMRRYLNKAGATVETSENGAEAVSKALNKSFDCILMDIRMPVMNGYEATQMLRQSGYDRPIIALTAQATEEDQKSSVEDGFTAYLSKPINMSHLKQILQAY